MAIQKTEFSFCRGRAFFYLCNRFLMENKMKNRIIYTFLLALLVTAGLFALYYVPVPAFNGKQLRHVDMLSDIRPDIVLPADTDTLILPPVVVKPEFADTCKTGMTCIEDFSDSTSRGMRHFYETMLKRNELDRPVRIAYLGDSFIEADILTGDLREKLQSAYGGCGVGYVPVTSRITGFRKTVQHTFGGWSAHSVMDSTYFDRTRQDLSNHYFIPTNGAYVTLKGTKYKKHLDSCEVSSIFFVAEDSVVLTSKVNGGEEKTYTFVPDGKLCMAQATGNIKSVRWSVLQADTATFYAVAMEGKSGVVVDNLSLRGGSGQQLLKVPFKTLDQFNRLRPYDLIVLQYGLNVASEEVSNYSYYTEAMKNVISHLKRAFPQASVLIVGVGDRCSRDENGNLATMQAIKKLVRYQQYLAADTHVAFWNMFQAMGGENSMVRMVEEGKANYDYTHINFKGGNHIATLLFETLQYGIEQYEKRMEYENQ